MEFLKNVSDLQLYMILTEIVAMSEDGEFTNETIQNDYIDLVGKIQHEFVERGYKNQETVEKYFGIVYQEPNRRYH